jgi:hypothetical protein
MIEFIIPIFFAVNQFKNAVLQIAVHRIPNDTLSRLLTLHTGMLPIHDIKQKVPYYMPVWLLI